MTRLRSLACAWLLTRTSHSLSSDLFETVGFSTLESEIGEMKDLHCDMRSVLYKANGKSTQAPHEW